MNTLHLEFDIEVEERTALAYQKIAQALNPQLVKRIAAWLEQQAQAAEQEKPHDPWLDFLDDIDSYAVDTGISDFSINHEYYLYGGAKRA